MENVTIQTARLTIASCLPEHLDSMWDAVQASLPELRPWMAWANGTKDDTAAFLSRSQEAWRKEEGFPFTMLLRGDVAGVVDLKQFDAMLSSAELGYWVRSDLAGHGYATEAAAALVDWGFETLKLHRIELHAGITNFASIRVAEKIGFHRVGVLRHGSRGVDDWYDCYLYDLLENEDRLRTETLAEERA